MKTAYSTQFVTANIRAASVGLVLAILTILFGQGLGIVFGLNEDAIKPRLKGNAAEVQESTWLAMPSSGGFVLATVAVLIVLIVWFLAARGEKSRP